MFTKIIDYFNSNYDKYVCIIENLKLTKLEVEFLGEKSVAFKILPSNILMVAGDLSELENYLSEDFSASVIFTPNEDVAKVIAGKKGLSVNPCKQYFYNRYNIDNSSVVVKKLEPTFENAKIVSENYTLNYSIDEIIKLLQNRFILGGFVDGKLCGFVGMHEERSVGLLEVLKDFRRKGYGSILLKSAVNYFLDNNFAAFSHVRSNNIASIKLHEEIGARLFDEEVYWIF